MALSILNNLTSFSKCGKARSVLRTMPLYPTTRRTIFTQATTKRRTILVNALSLFQQTQRWKTWTGNKKRKSDDHGKASFLMNYEILKAGFTQVALVNHEGRMLGTKTIQEAISYCNSRSMDLVLVAREAKPPVCRAQRRGVVQEAPKKEKEPKAPSGFKEKIKEIRSSETISEHDMQIKVSQARGFLLRKHKVLLTVKFKGREFDLNFAEAIILNMMQRVKDVIVIPSMGPRSLLKALPSRRQVSALLTPNLKVLASAAPEKSMKERLLEEKLERHLRATGGIVGEDETDLPSQEKTPSGGQAGEGRDDDVDDDVDDFDEDDDEGGEASQEEMDEYLKEMDKEKEQMKKGKKPKKVVDEDEDEVEEVGRGRNNRKVREVDEEEEDEDLAVPLTRYEYNDEEDVGGEGGEEEEDGEMEEEEEEVVVVRKRGAPAFVAQTNKNQQQSKPQQQQKQQQAQKQQPKSQPKPQPQKLPKKFQQIKDDFEDDDDEDDDFDDKPKGKAPTPPKGGKRF